MLSPADLLQLRRVQAELFPETVTISTQSAAGDGAGGETATWVSSGLARGRVGNPSGSLRTVAERLAAPATVQVTLPAGTNVSEGQRLTINGAHYRVQFVEQPKSFETARRVLAAKE